MYKCPICGKDSNRKGKPFTSKKPVMSHIDGSHDPDHKDVSGEEMREEITEVKSPTCSTDPDAGGVEGEGSDRQRDGCEASQENGQVSVDEDSAEAGVMDSDTSEADTSASMAFQTDSVEDNGPASGGSGDVAGVAGWLLVIAVGLVAVVFGDVDLNDILSGDNNGPDVI